MTTLNSELLPPNPQNNKSDGFIVLDKPSGMTSRQAGGAVARMFNQKTCGHIGTLDPMASGTLIIALGQATKMIPYMESDNIKEYLFQIKWGIRTDTDDITGTVAEQNDRIPTNEEIAAVLSQLVGTYDQMPPDFSAKKINGVPAYKLARQGRAPTLTPKKIMIYTLTMDEETYCMTCSAGTYVRAVVRDLAHILAAIATTSMIRRTRTNGVGIKDAVTLDILENNRYNGNELAKYLLAPDFGLDDIPVAKIGKNEAALFENGGFVSCDLPGGLCRVYAGNRFVGMGIIDGGVLKPKRILN